MSRSPEREEKIDDLIDLIKSTEDDDIVICVVYIKETHEFEARTICKMPIPVSCIAGLLDKTKTAFIAKADKNSQLGTDFDPSDTTHNPLELLKKLSGN